MTVEEFVRARVEETRKMVADAVDIESDLGYRLMRLCDSVLIIVEMQKTWPVLMEGQPKLEINRKGSMDDYVIQMTHNINWMTAQAYKEKFAKEPLPTPTIRKIAAMWSWHPDYDIAWG